MPFWTNCINKAFRNKFPNYLKLSDITPLYKKLDPSDKVNSRTVFYLYYRNYLKKLFMTSFMNICKNFWVNYCLVSEKYIPNNMLCLWLFITWFIGCKIRGTWIRYWQPWLSIRLPFFLSISSRKHKTKVVSSHSKWSAICCRGIPQG